jgi:hypothetical protein
VVDQEVAQPEVAVDHAGRAVRRAVRLEPAEPELEGRVGLTEAVEHGAVLGQLVARLEARRLLDRDAVDRRAGRPHLGAEPGARHLPLVVAQQLPGDRLTGEPLDDHAGAAQHPTVVAGEDARDRDAVLGRDPQHARLDVDADPAAAGRGARPQPLQDQLLVRGPADDVEGPRLPGRPARQAPQPVDPPPGDVEQREECARELAGVHEPAT